MECFYIVTACWIFSVCLHEFGHAWVADRGGDHTVREKGYLTLNPLKYTHPVYSLLLPVVFVFLGGIGLPGGAVYINDHLLRSRAWRTAVSLAGPAMNLLLVLLLALLFRTGLIPARADSLGAIAFAFLIQLELSSILLCLLPIPPMDGFRALAPWLPPRVADTALQHSGAGLLILFVVLWNVGPANDLFWTIVFRGSETLGVPPELGYVGYRAYRFWTH